MVSLVARLLSALAVFSAIMLFVGGLPERALRTLGAGLALYVLSTLGVLVFQRSARSERWTALALAALDLMAAVAIIRVAPAALPLVPVLLSAILVAHASVESRSHVAYVYFLSAFLFLGAMLGWRDRLPFTAQELAAQQILAALLWIFFGATFYRLFDRRRQERRDARRVERLATLLNLLNARWAPSREKLREAARQIGDEMTGDASGCRIVVHGTSHVLPPEGPSVHEPLAIAGIRVGTLILNRRPGRKDDARYLQSVGAALASFLAADRFWDGIEQRLDRFEAGLLLGDLKRAQADAGYLEGLKPVVAFARGAREFRPEDLFFMDVLWAAVEKIRPLAERRGLILAVDDQSRAIPLQGDRAALTRLVVASLESAGKAAPEGSGLRIATRVDDERVALSIRWPGNNQAVLEGDATWEGAYLQSALAAHGGRISAGLPAEDGTGSLSLSLRLRPAAVPLV